MLRHEIGVDITAWIGHFDKRRRIARDHQHPSAGRNQDQLVSARTVLQRKLLRHCPAPAHTHDIDDGHFKPVQQQCRNPRHQQGIIRHNRVGRSANTGHVESDKITVIEQFGHRRHRLNIRANAVEEQYGQLLCRLGSPPNRYPQCPPVNGLHAKFGRAVFGHMRSFGPSWDLK